VPRFDDASRANRCQAQCAIPNGVRDTSMALFRLARYWLRQRFEQNCLNANRWRMRPNLPLHISQRGFGLGCLYSVSLLVISVSSIGHQARKKSTSHSIAKVPSQINTNTRTTIKAIVAIRSTTKKKRARSSRNGLFRKGSRTAHSLHGDAAMREDYSGLRRAW